MLVWIDLETTGLDPRKELVLEVACVVTDDALNEVARFQRVTNAAKSVRFADVDPYVINMHFENGLWRESMLLADTYENTVAGIDFELSAMINKYGCTTVPKKNDDGIIVGETLSRPQLAGSTISFDRAFLDAHFPKTSKELHYRNVDVTSFNEVARRFWPELHEKRPRENGTKHRALDDILHSIQVLRYYVNNLGPRVFAGEGNPNP